MAQIGQMSVSTDPDAGISIYYKDNVPAGDYIYGVNTSKEWTGSKIHGVYGKVIYTGWFHTKEHPAESVDNNFKIWVSNILDPQESQVIPIFFSYSHVQES